MGGMPYHLEKGPMFATIEAMYTRPGTAPPVPPRPVAWHRARDPMGFSARRRPMVETVSTRLAPSVSNRCARNGSVMYAGGPSRRGVQAAPGQSRPDLLDRVLVALLRRRPRHHDRDADTRGGGLPRRWTACQHPATAPMPADTRHWPVEFFWKCGQPRFEGWVTWRDEAEGRNWAGDGDRRHTGDTRHRVPASLQRGPIAVDGIVATGFQGMWVCAHSDHPHYVIVGSIPTPASAWLVPPARRAVHPRRWAQSGLGRRSTGWAVLREHPIEFAQGPI